MLSEEQGNLLDADADALVNTGDPEADVLPPGGRAPSTD